MILYKSNEVAEVQPIPFFPRKKYTCLVGSGRGITDKDIDMKSIFKTPIFFILTAIFWAVSLSPAMAQDRSPSEAIADVTFTLETAIANGKLVFIGRGGNIEGVVNPDLQVANGVVVQINLINGDGAVHDIAVQQFDANSDQISGRGASTAISFRASENGIFNYICTLPGHVAAGMIGNLIVGESAAATKPTGMQIAKNPMEVGEAVGMRGPREFVLNLETTEVVGQLADGTTYTYWTFNNTVPGPFVRARVGDTITVNMHNAEDSNHIHSVDFHAVTGPGGGAAVTQAAPGQTKTFSFKALNPGLYVYHCATPMVAQHIANGMYGLLLVEPEGGLSEVDREFYVMQGELYTNARHGTRGHQEFSLDKMLDENPEHYIFNGSSGALTRTHRMEAEVGESVRVFFGVGGPNATSSFHIIGEIFDRVYDQASLTSPPLTNVQTTTVAPGGATMVEFNVDYPGRYILVDHALARLEKGLVGFLYVTGEADDRIFHNHEANDQGSD